ncbi:MAG TPA: DUF4240 domain-containing protein [Bacteroidales bacterium]
MGTLSIIAFVLVLIIILRLSFRKKLDFPDYSGQLFADNSGINDIMPESMFWKIIHDTGQNSSRTYGVQCQLLTDTLRKLPEEEIIRFDRTLNALMSKSYNHRLWEAVYALNGGCSDDCFEYFRSWLIGQGRNKFYWTIKYPRLLFLIGVKEIIENYEGLAYCTFEAYQSKLGKELPGCNDISYEDGGKMFNESLSILRYPELVLLAW